MVNKNPVTDKIMDDYINKDYKDGIVRLWDVFVLGPIYIYISTFIDNIVLKLLMIVYGVTNIIYNLHNYLLLNAKVIDKPWKIIDWMVDKVEGKTQNHRLYNVIVMYPFFLYIWYNIELPKWLTNFFIIDIILGFIYNLDNYIVIRNSNNSLDNNLN